MIGYIVAEICFQVAGELLVGAVKASTRAVRRRISPPSWPVDAERADAWLEAAEDAPVVLPRLPDKGAVDVAEAFMFALRSGSHFARDLCDPELFGDPEREAALCCTLEHARPEEWEIVRYHFSCEYDAGEAPEWFGVEFDVRLEGEGAPRSIPLLVWTLVSDGEWWIHSTDWNADGVPDA